MVNILSMDYYQYIWYTFYQAILFEAMLLYRNVETDIYYISSLKP